MYPKIIFIETCNSCLLVYLLFFILLWSRSFTNSVCQPKKKCDISNNNNNDCLESQMNNYSQNLINSFSLQCLQQTEKTTKRSRKLSLIVRKQINNNKYNVQKSIYFLYYKNGKMLFKNSPGLDEIQQVHSHILKTCNNEKISFIFHGWTESCQTEWVPKLMERLAFHRGGCIVCIDYSTWSKKSYMELLQKYNTINEILYEEFLALMQKGMDPSNIFMFGFSYGGQLASKIGSMLKPEYILKKIDICDMAGPGFDFLTSLNHSEAAENVQCYYTSLDKGSHFQSCHQNIRMGHCGYTQPAILSQPYFSSHGLCVLMYINAFDFPFYALQKAPRFCVRGKTIENLPNGFTVGYKENGYSHMTGDIFVPTTLNYPYNLSRREIILYKKYLDGAQ